MTGADVFIDALLRRMDNDLSFFVDAVHCARLPPPGKNTRTYLVSRTLISTCKCSIIIICDVVATARAIVGNVLAAAAHPQVINTINVC